MWYAAHIVVAYKSLLPGNDEIIADESVVLIEATDRESAREKAGVILNNYAVGGENVPFLQGGAEICAVVVKRIIDVSNDDGTNARRPKSGSEISYYLLKFHNLEGLYSYMNDEGVYVKFWRREDLPE